MAMTYVHGPYATEEALGYSRLRSWPLLLQALNDHTKEVRQSLAVHTSTACQPQKAEALVPDLLVAGLRDAHSIGFGEWTCTLYLPALFAPGDAHPYQMTVRQAPSKKQVVKDPM